MNATSPMPAIELPPAHLAPRPQTNPGCTAHRHGSSWAYRHGCRCREAVSAARRVSKLNHVGRRYSPPPVPAIGTARRLRALATIGFGPAELAPLLGWSVHRVKAIRLMRHATVQPATANRIRALTDALAGTPPLDTFNGRRQRANARTQGWASLAEWADIDDPDDRPDGEFARTNLPCRTSRARIPVIDADDWEFMLTIAGCTHQTLATHWGVGLDAVRHAHSRALDAAAPVVEPVPLNPPAAPDTAAAHASHRAA